MVMSWRPLACPAQRHPPPLADLAACCDAEEATTVAHCPADVRIPIMAGTVATSLPDLPHSLINR